MVPDLNSVMIWAATYFIHSTLLLGAVWIWFRRREPASHAFREAVWKLAAIGGLVTASLQLGLEVQSPLNTALSSAWNSVGQSGTPGRSVAATPNSQFDTAAVSHDFAKSSIPSDFDASSSTQLIDFEQSADDRSQEFEGQAQLTDTAAPTIGSTPAAPILSDTRAAMSAGLNPRFQLALMATLAAFCGAIVALSGWGLVRLLMEQWEFRQRLSTCRTVKEGVAHAILQELLQQSNIQRRVRLMVDEHDLEPGACGWLHWQIVLPARAVTELSHHELRGLLAHELAHLVRGDQWWLLIGRLLAVCFGWQPLNRIALREWQRASEYLCDAWAIQRSVPRLSLARCLTTVAEWRLVGLATVAGLGSGHPSNLSQRVERLVEDVPLADPWQRYSRRHLLAAGGCLVAVFMVSLAPAASLSKQSPAIAADQSQGASESNQSPHETAQITSENEENPVVPEVELLTTHFEETHPEILVTTTIVESLRVEVSHETQELIQDLDAMQRVLPGKVFMLRHPDWRAQINRLRQRVQNIERLQQTLSIPL